MPDLTTLSHGLDAKNATCLAIIETPKGSRNKFSYDPEHPFSAKLVEDAPENAISGTAEEVGRVAIRGRVSRVVREKTEGGKQAGEK